MDLIRERYEDLCEIDDNWRTPLLRILEFRPFEQARDFACSLGLKNWLEWRAYCKSGKRPADIPSSPYMAYKDKGWVSYGDWLGTGNVASQLRELRPFEQAREFVCSLELKNRKEWDAYSKSGKRPADIPSNPDRAYRGKGWISWGDWLGTGNVALRLREFRPFPQAREFARSLGLRGWQEWRAYCKSGKKPADIPSRPDDVYKGNGWISWGDWLGKPVKKSGCSGNKKVA